MAPPSGTGNFEGEQRGGTGADLFTTYVWNGSAWLPVPVPQGRRGVRGAKGEPGDALQRSTLFALSDDETNSGLSAYNFLGNSSTGIVKNDPLGNISISASGATISLKRGRYMIDASHTGSISSTATSDANVFISITNLTDPMTSSSALGSVGPGQQFSQYTSLLVEGPVVFQVQKNAGPLNGAATSFLRIVQID